MIFLSSHRAPINLPNLQFFPDPIKQQSFHENTGRLRRPQTMKPRSSEFQWITLAPVETEAAGTEITVIMDVSAHGPSAEFK